MGFLQNLTEHIQNVFFADKPNEGEFTILDKNSRGGTVGFDLKIVLERK